MERIQDYVAKHTTRGECQCGQCIGKGDKPDPAGHTADLVFFKVAKAGEPSADEFRRLTEATRGEFTDVNVFDGKEHGYIELGAWIGDQGLAMQYMGLGHLLGLFDLMTPKMLVGLPDALVMQMAGSGYVAIKATGQAVSR